MAYTLQKIGKSLVKYFKPVRVIPPHLPGQATQSPFPEPTSGNLDEEGRRLFRLLNTKTTGKSEDQGADGEDLSREGLTKGQDGEDEVQFSEKAPSQWLELVLLLLLACKRAASKVKARTAVDSYRRALSSRGRTRIRTIGSIVNTTADAFESREEDAA